MKQIAALFLTLLVVKTNYAQMSCCAKPSAGQTFASLTTDKNFLLSHHEPEKFVLENPKGKTIEFKTPDGKTASAYEIKSTERSDKYLFVVHEWWGLNDYVKQESERFFSELKNVNVIAIDLYNGKVATSRDSAAKYMNAVKTNEAQDVINGLINYVGKKASIATVGWCFGGGWSLQTSLLLGKQSKACIMYYGMPEDNKEILKTLNCPVLFVHAEQDKWINKEVVTKFETSMKELKKSLEVKSYDAVHGFANPSNPKYAKDFAEEAFAYSLLFLKKNF